MFLILKWSIKTIIFIYLFKDNIVRNGESVRKLNDGLNLIEKQNDERSKQLEKVISAEIKARLAFFLLIFLLISLLLRPERSLINFVLRLKYMLAQKRKGALVLSLSHDIELITQYSDKINSVSF